MSRKPSNSARPERAIEQSRPFAEMMAIALPSVVTMTSYTVMQFVDGLMVSRIEPPDDVYVAAQGNGGMAIWLLMSFTLGLTGVVNSFVSQNLGAGRPERGAAYAWTGLWVCVAWSLMILPMWWVLPRMFVAMNHAPDLVALETSYAQTLLAGAFLTLAARSLAHYFYGMHRPRVVMVSVVTANVVNVFCNALLIYGEAGPPEGTPFAAQFRAIAQALNLPAFGVTGAALGTVIGTAVEFLIPLFIFLSPKYNEQFGTRGAWRFSWGHLKDLLRIGWPPGAMFANEMICWGFLMAYMLGAAGKAAGDDPEVHNTAGWIALRYMHVSFMPAVGLSIAVSAIVGRWLGARRPDVAAARAWLGLKITITYMGACALIFVFFRHELIGLFVPDDMPPELAGELVRIGATVMIAAAVFQVFDAIAIIMSGALRGAGDTLWPGIVTLILSWTCIPGVGIALIYLMPELGSIGPWIGASLYIILLSLFMLWRFVNGKWRSIDLVKRDETEAVRICPYCGCDVSALPEGHTCPECGVVGEEAVAGVTPGAM